ncbi:hypothetical protein P8452_67197 [Trifolium repens]|nr:hypothetical protein P8452_67197 [Trifolium repens]
MVQKEEVDQKNEALPSAVFKFDLHCAGCVKKIKRAVLHFDGVEDVKVDMVGNKVTVIGKVDSNKVRDKLEDKIKKKVEIVSAPPKKDIAGDKPQPEKKKQEEKKKNEPDDKKPDDVKKTEEKSPKQSVQNTVVLKIKLHCEGCIQKIEKIILKIKGVESVNIDGAKDLVTVKGAIDTKEIVSYLTEKFKRTVEVVQPKKEDGKNKEKDEGKQKSKENQGGGGDKKEGGKIEEVATKVEVNKMEHYGYGHQPPMYWYDGYEPGQSSNHTVEVQQGYSNSNQQGYYGYNHVNQQEYNNSYYSNHGNEEQGYGYNEQGYGYNNHVNQGEGGYMVDPPFYMHPNNPPPQMFSDENPNACSLM